MPHSCPSAAHERPAACLSGSAHCVPCGRQRTPAGERVEAGGRGAGYRASMLIKLGAAKLVRTPTCSQPHVPTRCSYELGTKHGPTANTQPHVPSHTFPRCAHLAARPLHPPDFMNRLHEKLPPPPLSRSGTPHARHRPVPLRTVASPGRSAALRPRPRRLSLPATGAAARRRALCPPCLCAGAHKVLHDGGRGRVRGAACELQDRGLARRQGPAAGPS